MLVLARDPKCEDPKLAFSLFWVDAKAPGVKINPLHKIGWHLVSTCEVYLDNVVVEEKDMVGEEGKGFLNGHVQLRNGTPDQRLALHGLCGMRL